MLHIPVAFYFFMFEKLALIRMSIWAASCLEFYQHIAAQLWFVQLLALCASVTTTFYDDLCGICQCPMGINNQRSISVPFCLVNSWTFPIPLWTCSQLNGLSDYNPKNSFHSSHTTQLHGITSLHLWSGRNYSCMDIL